MNNHFLFVDRTGFLLLQVKLNLDNKPFIENVLKIIHSSLRIHENELVKKMGTIIYQQKRLNSPTISKSKKTGLSSGLKLTSCADSILCLLKLKIICK